MALTRIASDLAAAAKAGPGPLRVELAYQRAKVREALLVAVAWRLPAGVAYWCAIRVMAHATTGAFGSTVVPELTAMQALERWEDASGGDRRVGQRA